jgi:hypothetical protein
MKYDFSKIEKVILTQNVELLIKYRNDLYWLTVGNKSFFGGDNYTTLNFLTPQALLNSPLIDNKKLSDIWNDVDVLSFESGWRKTINTNQFR